MSEITDKMRLDFMGEAPRELYCVYGGYVVGYSLTCHPDDLCLGKTAPMPSVREAIDEAMRLEKERLSR